MSGDHPALPPAVSRVWLAVAGATWVVASLLAPGPTPISHQGPFAGRVTMTTDVVAGRYGPWALGETQHGPVLVDFPEQAPAGRGDVLGVSGTLGGDPGFAAGRPFGGVLTVRHVESVMPSTFLPHRAGRLVRSSVEERLAPFDDGRALLAGFLIGDTSRISEADVESMRRSGLAHFVAVSGSNVALFLGLLAVLAGPLALGPRRRALIGLLALPVYAAATRFEPSVMRASVMAALALGGRLMGIVLEAWQLLSLAVVVLLVGDPGLTRNVGFQLSVAATIGVLAGSRWPVATRLRRALAITMGAQLAVAPLLLIHFGTVPLLSPVVNLAAAPLVAVSTTLGAVGVAGVGILVAPAGWVAGLVVALARGAASWPQVSGWEALAVLALATVFRLAPAVRAVVVAVTSVALALAVSAPTQDLPDGGVAVLDVGQGDAILLNGGDGRFALVDGGPDVSALIDKLRRYSVTSLDLVVLTHVHADHATGLSGVVETMAIAEVWADTRPHTTPASREFFSALAERGMTPVAPTPGTHLQLGVLDLVVAGPVRRYASPNDQSIVIRVAGPRRSMLLAGDIETYAQSDLAHLRADVLKVPHQGAGTSEASWLTAVGSEIAVISVGPNDFGHPAPWVVSTLEETSEVLRTDQDGDVIVDLSH